jgi:hypothetical protein
MKQSFALNGTAEQALQAAQCLNAYLPPQP